MECIDCFCCSNSLFSNKYPSASKNLISHSEIKSTQVLIKRVKNPSCIWDQLLVKIAWQIQTRNTQNVGKSEAPKNETHKFNSIPMKHSTKCCGTK